MKPQNDQTKDANRDPITGAPGSHPVGTGIGSATGAAAGAAIGAVGGPVGMAAGGVIGAIVGAGAGHAVAEGIDPTVEDEYWGKNFRNEPYYENDYDYNDYRPAYRMGYSNYGRNDVRSFDEAEPDLASRWEEKREGSRLSWDRAKEAARAGWHRVERVLPGDADKDGR